MNNSIKEMRTAMGLTQDDLAEKLEVSRQTIISLEKGRYNPSLLLAFKIAKLFKRRIEDIFQPEEE
ncbi:helix-turn-helix transcriptional regulator [Sporosarcina sp. Sa2YVA2]|uniref:Helix-turn-helix transcriptional regulator n=2 Tax=Sporosarcina quadrami TaxID=2762234 RepID=A0ABR8UE38_9BACL|nr:helix-turn-helix transcriptional regulator [Sporosarcina quadrami]MBD7985859.1 helix-turn-helix transcriptional regulator [Sporosarcina quadrami]